MFWKTVWRTVSQLSAGHRISRWIAFEPNLRNFSFIPTSKNYKDIEMTLVPCGLSNVVAEFSFSSNGASSKAGVGLGSHSVCRVLPFVDMYPNTIGDFVKLDIEGGELRALKGVVKLLKRCRLTVAMSLYHKWDDIPVLIQLLGYVMPGGDFYLRQKAFSCLYTVLYYISAK